MELGKQAQATTVLSNWNPSMSITRLTRSRAWSGAHFLADRKTRFFQEFTQQIIGGASRCPRGEENFTRSVLAHSSRLPTGSCRFA